MYEPLLQILQLAAQWGLFTAHDINRDGLAALL